MSEKKSVEDILRSNQHNTYVMSCFLSEDDLYRTMREDIRTLSDEIVRLKLLSTENVKFISEDLESIPCKQVTVAGNVLHVINICSLIDTVWPEYWHDKIDDFQMLLGKWCEKNDFSFYSEPREHFDALSALKMAARDKYKGVVLQDLRKFLLRGGFSCGFTGD